MTANFFAQQIEEERQPKVQKIKRPAIKAEDTYQPVYTWHKNALPKAHVEKFPADAQRVQRFVADVRKLSKQQQDALYRLVFLVAAATQLVLTKTRYSKSDMPTLNKFKSVDKLLIKFLRRYVRLGVRGHMYVSMIAER